MMQYFSVVRVTKNWTIDCRNPSNQWTDDIVKFTESKWMKAAYDR